MLARPGSLGAPGGRIGFARRRGLASLGAADWLRSAPADLQLPRNSDSGVGLWTAHGEEAELVEVNLRTFDEQPSRMASVRTNRGGRGEVYALPDRPAELGPEGAWNAMGIESRDGRLQVRVNSQEVVNRDLRPLATAADATPGVSPDGSDSRATPGRSGPATSRSGTSPPPGRPRTSIGSRRAPRSAACSTSTNSATRPAAGTAAGFAPSSTGSRSARSSPTPRPNRPRVRWAGDAAPGPRLPGLG